MTLSMGMIDRIFGKKIELEIPDGKGNIIRRKVTEKWYNKMLQDGKISAVSDEIVSVHMLHPIEGYTVLNWVIDKDIDRKTVDKFINEDGELFAITTFEDGQQKVMVVLKDVFDLAHEKFSSV